MNQKIIITRKGGHYSIKGNGDAYLLELATGSFKRGEMEPTFWQKLRRFCKRLANTINAKIDGAAALALGTDEAAEDVPVIGLLEERV